VRRLFVSDLHLADPDQPAFRTFARLLARESRAVDEVYLLGDLCEVWIGDDDDGPLARAIVEVLAHAAQQARVCIMAGNRDFLLGPRFAAETGAELIDDPYPLDGGLLLAHGDAYCVDDAQYQAVRATLRSPDWQREILAKSLEERRALAGAMRAESRATNANKPANIMDVSAVAVARVMTEHRATRLIHGHTHRPAVHREPWGRRYVLGAWEHAAWTLNQEDDRFALRCRPLVR
jgi:UDP-2,3-diacylglucosamine hydrolase